MSMSSSWRLAPLKDHVGIHLILKYLRGVVADKLRRASNVTLLLPRRPLRYLDGRGVKGRQSPSEMMAEQNETYVQC